jgi:phosphatidylinositol alpha-1,6-mannosyltransferase
MIATELFAPGGVQRVGREVMAALSDAEVWTLLDTVVPSSRGACQASNIRLGGGSKMKLGLWALDRARHRCSSVQLLLMHLHLAPIALPMVLRGARSALFLYGVEAWRPLTRVEQFVVDHCDPLIAISRYTVRRFKDANPRYAARSIEICPPGVAPARTPPRSIAPEAAALMVSRMSSFARGKGHEFLIRLWPGVRARVPDAMLILVGDGDDRARLEVVAAEAGVAGAVHFTGLVTDDELAGWYERCAMFVMPSDQEGFGLVFLEAMRAGKPCIGWAGAPAEVIEDGVTGFIVAPHDEVALTNAVVRLFNDVALRERLGRNGKSSFHRMFTAQHFGNRLRQLLVAPTAPQLVRC